MRNYVAHHALAPRPIQVDNINLQPDSLSANIDTQQQQNNLKYLSLQNFKKIAEICVPKRKKLSKITIN